ncbi:MAG: hypothetical protein KIG63_07770 [Methanobrevibacter sp.]|nr:hypothetical protein [Methanobrevibacter sp.]
MSYLKERLVDTGIVGLGIFIIIWYIVKLISCIMIAGLISIRLGLSGYYWWFSSIIICCVLGKIIFFGNSSGGYSELVKRYNYWSGEK